jgi:DOPA 4,5-dioxygenase
MDGNGPLRAPVIDSWHAHVYFEASTRDVARALRERAIESLAAIAAIGRFHERPVGPHPMGSFQLSFAPGALRDVVEWLLHHRGALDVFMHPNTGDELGDHRDRALWIGRSHALNLDALSPR